MKVLFVAGLDPARPFFEDTDKVVHLDASDAEFVDIIHTDTDPFLGKILSQPGVLKCFTCGTPAFYSSAFYAHTGLGMMKPTGHYDFYPNGGQHMTGCPSKLSFLTGNAVCELPKTVYLM